MNSLVSIVLPTRNSIRYLRERIDSIRSQTYPHYEVVVVDTNSTDGTLEMLKDWASDDARVSIYDTPPGLYEAFNYGIDRSRGDYVYIATSDDTMRNDAIEKMVSALDAHPDCDVCDSPVMQIDENGAEIKFGDKRYLDPRGHLVQPLEAVHIRRAPYDFIQHCGAQNVYLSLTQILVRKSLYDKVGRFPVDLGASADFLWGMRVGAVANVIYVPEKLGTFRTHSGQATGSGARFAGRYNRTSMVRVGFSEWSGVQDGIELIRLADFKASLMPLKLDVSWPNKILSVFQGALRHPFFLSEYIYWLAVEKLIARDPRWQFSAYNAIYRRIAMKLLRKYPIEIVKQSVSMKGAEE